MALYELVLPKMGESVAEATIIKWVKKSGDKIDIDESVLEIATDKVDSEVPSPVSGKLLNIFFNENDVVQVGAVIATIEIESELDTDEDIESEQSSNVELLVQLEEYVQNDGIPHLYNSDSIEPVPSIDFSNAARFYSPLV
jgi:2-oxoglutarate dehydrogenase E2 component (dihydrolipoamide succinyltransferase)